MAQVPFNGIIQRWINREGFVSDGADEYIKLNDIDEDISYVCLTEKCKP